MTRGGLWSLASLALFGAACGSASTPQPITVTENREVTSGNEPTRFQAQRLVGHYSTTDGKSGVIVDRRGAVVKAKLDGQNEVKPLKASGGPHGTTEHRSDDGSIWLRISE